MTRKAVDDALISTDIDNIIRFISSHKRVEMGALAKQFGMKKDAIKKWIAILENEGYVNVENRLLSEYVLWAGGEAVHEPIIPESLRSRDQRRPPDQPSDVRQQPAKPVEIPVEDRIARIAAKAEGKDIASSIVSSFKSEKDMVLAQAQQPPHEEKKAPEAQKPKEPRMQAVPLEDVLVSSKSDEKLLPPREEEGEKLLEAAATKTVEVDKQSMENLGGELSSLKRALTEYMEEIKLEKVQLEKLRFEKDKELSEAYQGMESKFRNSYDSLSDRIMEKEGRIIELKERVMELPSKVSEIDKIEKALDSITSESKKTLAANRAEVEKARKSVAGADESLKSELDGMQGEIASRKKELEGLLTSITAIEGKEQDLKKEVESVNKHLSDINEGIAFTYASLSSLAQKRSDLSARAANLKSTIEQKEGEVSETYSRLQEVRKAESLITDYLSDYERKMNDVIEYASSSDKDISKLKEAAEMKYLKNYLKELDRMSSEYDGSYETVLEKEKSMDERIAQSKKNLENMIRESRNLVKNIEKGGRSAPDLEKTASEMRDKQSAAMSKIMEKSSERQVLEQELQKYEHRKAPAQQPQKAPERKQPPQKGGKKPGKK
jgi:chromosome segregation ATPase